MFQEIWNWKRNKAKAVICDITKIFIYMMGKMKFCLLSSSGSEMKNI